MINKERLIQKIRGSDNENNELQIKTEKIYSKILLILSLFITLDGIFLALFQLMCMDESIKIIEKYFIGENTEVLIKSILITIMIILIFFVVKVAKIRPSKKQSLKLTAKDVLKLIIEEDYNIFECVNVVETVEDINVLRDYNLYDDLKELDITEEVVNDCIIFKKNNEEVFLGFFKDVVCEPNHNQEFYKIFKFSACTKINTLKRTEIKVCYDEETLNPIVQNYFDKIKEIDINMENSYKDYLSDRFSYLKDMEELNLDEFIISKNMEEQLIKILSNYSIPFRIFLKDGIIFIDILTDGSVQFEYKDEDFEKMCLCMNVIDEVLEVFINNI